ncbi:TetR family transcriptional regulator [Rhizobium sp. Leaf391]|uniref:TetR/AcrR family transcriptional regulator n=1 Tax=Rhizobium sp. Leaf391 TaxID=1736360 RepID=UPI00071461BB|nr:TetR/AcrR family transcriptional regulator [Rhizobium sp. Leaf391]KQS95814.1 TetR family transcriptional regulator [Rhizobium sp. Leaf391]
MSSMENGTQSPTRRRLTRDDRLRQLLDVAWRIIREEGTEALTLGHLSERAGVTKPVVYDHFTTRPGLLTVLYHDFDDRQTVLMDKALAESQPTLRDRARVIASAYVQCVLLQGKEVSGISAALAGSPELEKVKRECETELIDKCRNILAPFAGTTGITMAGLWGMFGAAEALSRAAAADDITAAQAEDEIQQTIVSMVQRTAGQ